MHIPLLALPTLTRAAVDAAVPGLAEPRVEALLRSLPKDARRGLIPIAATAAAFMDFMGAPSTNVQHLADWLKESRGIPEGLIRFDAAAVPAHLTAQLAVLAAAPGIRLDLRPSGLRDMPALLDRGEHDQLRGPDVAQQRATRHRRGAAGQAGLARGRGHDSGESGGGG